MRLGGGDVNDHFHVIGLPVERLGPVADGTCRLTTRPSHCPPGPGLPQLIRSADHGDRLVGQDHATVELALVHRDRTPADETPARHTTPPVLFTPVHSMMPSASGNAPVIVPVWYGPQVPLCHWDPPCRWDPPSRRSDIIGIHHRPVSASP